MILGNDKMIIGYDLSYHYAQISYCRLNADTPETFALVEGTRQYNIPVCMFRRREANQWFVGKEASVLAGQEDGVLLENLLQAALDKKDVNIQGEKFENVALLALFVKRSLYLPGNDCRPDKIAGIMFTVPFLSEKMIALLQKLASLLDIPGCKISFQSREESIYHYIIRQPKELWNEDVIVFDDSEEGLKSYRFTKNINTKPMVAFVEETDHGQLVGNAQEKDDQFLEIVRESAQDTLSSVFLLGEGFNGDWCQDSLRLLCRNRRVFKGNDLYSKGACFGAQERMNKRQGQQMVFLGKDKLKTNIGMRLSRQGEDSYLAILDGGENWYECHKQWDVILREGNIIKLALTPLDGRNVRYVEIVLDGLPIREPKTTRLHLEAVMVNEDTLEMRITDKGFGEIAPASSMYFTQQIDLSAGG